MKSLCKLSVNNPVLVHIITIAVIVLGSYTLINMPRELERDVSFNWALIWVTYHGVSPEEIEKLIAKPIEDEIADVDKIESITSTAAEGFAGISDDIRPWGEIKRLSTEHDRNPTEIPQPTE